MAEYLKIKWIRNTVFFLFIGISSSLVWTSKLLNDNFDSVTVFKLIGLIVVGFVTNVLITLFVGFLATFITSFLFEQETTADLMNQVKQNKDSNSFFDKFYLFMIFIATTDIIMFGSKSVNLFSFLH